MDGDAHLAPLHDFLTRGSRVDSETAAWGLAADIWAWRLRWSGVGPVFCDGAVFVTETTQDDRVAVRIDAPEVALTLRYERSVPTEVRVVRAGERVIEFRFGLSSTPEVIDAPAAAPTLDHVGGASHVEPPSAPAAAPFGRPPHCLDLTDLHGVLAELTQAVGALPEREQIAERHLTLTRCIGALCDAPPSDPGREPALDWIGVRGDNRLVVASGRLYAVISVDATSANLASGALVWQIDKDGSGTRIRVLGGEVAGSWTVLPSGEVIDHAPPPWRPTHTVGADPAAVGGVPTGTYAVGTVLDPGLDVKLIDTTANGWALVECSNGWRCYVAAHSLRRLAAGPRQTPPAHSAAHDAWST